MTIYFRVTKHVNHIPFKKVDPILEDPETSQEVWESKAPPEIINHYSPSLVLDMVDKTSRILNITAGLESYPWFKKNKIIHSIQHITLPEALVYYEILSSKITDKKCNVTFKFISHKNDIMQFELVFPNVTYVIDYHLKLLKASIFKKGIQVGSVKYVLRNQKLEEIIGDIDNKPLILDPVWKTTKKSELREEYLTIGSKRISISYDKHEKHALVWQQNIQSKFSSKMKLNQHEDKKRKIVTKDIQFLNYKGQTSLCFTEGILLPIFGQWEFSKTNS